MCSSRDRGALLIGYIVHGEPFPPCVVPSTCAPLRAAGQINAPFQHERESMIEEIPGHRSLPGAAEWLTAGPWQTCNSTSEGVFALL